MQRLISRSAVLLLLLGGVFGMVSCSGDSGANGTEAVTEGASEHYDETARTDTEPGAADETPAPAGSGQPQDADAIFKQEQQARRLAEQQKKILFREHMIQARRYLQAGDLGRAETAVLRAMEMDAANPEAVEFLKTVLASKGEEAGSEADLAEYLTNQRKLIRQAKVARVNDKYVKANQAYQQEDYANAKILLEEANTLIRFDEFQTDFGALATDVPTLLSEVSRTLTLKKKQDEESLFEQTYKDAQKQEQKRMRRRAEEVRRLLIEAIESFQRGEFENTSFLAKKVLKIVPGHIKAKELVHVARQAKNSAWRDAQYHVRRASYQKWLEEVRETQIPYTAILSWPGADDWSDLTRRRGRRAAASIQLNETEAVRAIKAKLENETVSWDFAKEETTLVDAVKHIRATQNINIVVDREVATEKGEEAVPITLTNQNLGSALRLMLENVGLAYTFRDDVLFVTTKEKALGSPVPQVYWVRDLTISLPHFKAPDLRLRPGGTGEEAKTAIWGEDLERTQDTSIDQLMDLVRENVAPTTWETEGFSLGASAGQIVAVTTPEIHRQLENFLDDLREFTKLTVHVEARFISIEKATLDLIGNEFRGLGGTNPGTVALLDDVTNGPPGNASRGLDNSGPGFPAASSLSPSAGAFFNDNSDGDVRARTENIFDNTLGSILSAQGGLGLAFTWLDDLEVTSLLRAVEKSRNSTIVSAPRLTIYNNQRANLTLVNQVSYVKDYDVEVAQTAFIADPLIDVVQDGLTLDVRPTVSHDRKYVTLEIQPTVANLMRPIRTFETNLSGLTTPVIIELPELDVQSAATTVRVPDNGYLVIGGFKHISTVDRRAETPILSNIPILSFFFSTKGRSDEIRDLIIVLHVNIVDLSDQERNLAN